MNSVSPVVRCWWWCIILFLRKSEQRLFPCDLKPVPPLACLLTSGFFIVLELTLHRLWVVGAWYSAFLDSSSCTLTRENQLRSEAGVLPGNWKEVIKNGVFQTTSDILLVEGNRLLGIWTALSFGLYCKIGWDFRPPVSWGLRTQLKAY